MPGGGGYTPPAGGGGNVVGPASATDGALAVYDGVTGKLLKDSTLLFSTGGNPLTVKDGGGNEMMRVADIGTTGQVRTTYLVATRLAYNGEVVIANSEPVDAQYLKLDTNGVLFATVTRIENAGGIACGGVTAVKAANYVATVFDVLVPVDSSGGAVQVTLPAANAAKGQEITVKAAAVTANAITVVRAGADTIEGQSAGQTTVTVPTALVLGAYTFRSDGGSKWYLIAVGPT